MAGRAQAITDPLTVSTMPLPSLRLRWWIWTFRALLSTSSPSPYTASLSCSADSTRPGFCSSAWSSACSRRDRSTGSPAMNAAQAAGS